MSDDAVLWLDLFWRFMVVSLIAFGGGQAALPLIEQIAVKEAGWVSEQDFAAAVGCGYLTPGPVLITATFIGYRVAGLGGATAATVGVFLMPWFLAAVAARLVGQALERPWLRAFGRGAAAAVVGLLAVTVVDLARHSFTSLIYVLIALLAVAISLRTKIHPILILVAGGALGAILG
jgi:chromate transporter